MLKNNEFGNFIKNRRIKQRLTVRTFCIRHNLNPSMWSGLERGLYKPPKNISELKNIARMFNIATPIGDKFDPFNPKEPNVKKWEELVYAAKISRQSKIIRYTRSKIINDGMMPPFIQYKTKEKFIRMADMLVDVYKYRGRFNLNKAVAKKEEF